MSKKLIFGIALSLVLFGGVSLEGTVIAARDETNAEYYGRPVTPGQILSGKVKALAGARKLQTALARY